MLVVVTVGARVVMVVAVVVVEVVAVIVVVGVVGVEAEVAMAIAPNVEFATPGTLSAVT